MAGNGKPSIGTAYVQIKPSLSGIRNEISSGLSGAGAEASSVLSSGMTKGRGSSIINNAISVALGNGISSAAGAVVGKMKELFGNAMREADSVMATSGGLKSLGFDATEVEAGLDKMRKSANETAATMGSLSDGVLALSASWGEFAVDDAIALSDAILAFDGSADAANHVANAITQLGQVALDGPLDAQTWLSLRNSGLLPAAGMVAEMYGTDLPGLKKALGEGSITTRQFMDSLKKLDSEATKSGKSLKQMAKDKAASTWSGSWTTASNTIVSSLSQAWQKVYEGSGAGEKIINLGDSIASAIPKATEIIGGLGNSFRETADRFKSNPAVQNAINEIKKLIDTLSPAVSEIFDIVKRGYEIIKPYLQAIFDFYITRIANAVTMLVNTVKIAWSIIYPVIKLAIEAVLWVLDVVRPVFTTIMGIINDVSTTVTRITTSIRDTIFGFVAKIINAVTGFFTNILNSTRNSMRDFAMAIAHKLIETYQTFKENIQKIVDKVLSFGGKLLDAGRRLVENLWNGINGAYTWLKNNVLWIGGKVIEWVGRAFGAIWDVGKNVIEGLWNGMNDKVQWIKNKISGFCQSALDAIKEFFGIHSPSRVMREQVGKYIAVGMADGITKYSSEVDDAMSELGAKALSDMAGINGELSSGINSYVEANVGLGAEANARVIQNNNITIKESFDLEVAEAALGYAVAMA